MDPRTDASQTKYITIEWTPEQMKSRENIKHQNGPQNRCILEKIYNNRIDLRTDVSQRKYKTIEWKHRIIDWTPEQMHLRDNLNNRTDPIIDASQRK